MAPAPSRRVTGRVPLRRSVSRLFPRSRWSRLVAAAVALGVMGAAAITVADPAVRLGVASLAREWRGCLVHGEAPGPQQAVTSAYARHAAAARQRHNIPSEAVDLPIVEPRSHVPEALLPLADRPVRPDRPVVVAVVDSGVSRSHPDLAGATILPGVDVMNPCGDGTTDVTGHGTAVAGVMVSGTHGASPDVEILPVRISLATGKHHSWASAAGIVAATRRGADVINMSYANQSAGPSLLEWLATRYAEREGVALIAAAGNNPHRPVGYPAAYPGVLSVTAVDGRGELSAYAARYGQVDVAAPGSRVLTLSADGAFRTASGTSLAAPIVTASVAHLLRTEPSLTGAEALAAVKESTTRGAAVDVTQASAGIGSFNLSTAFAGVCRLASSCTFSAVLHRTHVVEMPEIGDPRRVAVPGEPR